MKFLTWRIYNLFYFFVLHFRTLLFIFTCKHLNVFFLFCWLEHYLLRWRVHFLDLLFMFVEKKFNKIIDGFGMSKNLCNGGWLTYWPAIFFNRYIDICILNSFQVYKISENIVDFSFGFNLNYNFFNFFWSFGGLSHQHDTNFVHRLKEVAKELAIYFSSIED